MRLRDSTLVLTPTDIGNHLAGREITQPNRAPLAVERIELREDPREALRNRGNIHEKQFVDSLAAEVLSITELRGRDNAAATLEAMTAGPTSSCKRRSKATASPAASTSFFASPFRAASVRTATSPSTRGSRATAALGQSSSSAPTPPSSTRCSVSAKREGASVVLSVRDNGGGIPAEYHEAIVEMFRRVPDGDGGEAGSGMGLAIVKRIVETHGGQVWVDSTPGAGSVFWVRLPAV